MGESGEAAALSYLRHHGFRILATDWSCRLGQIDIVADEAGTLVIVEVKSRRSNAFGLPQEAVDHRKRNKLRLLTHAYLQASGLVDQPVRIDVVAVLFDAGLQVRDIVHIRDAVGG